MSKLQRLPDHRGRLCDVDVSTRNEKLYSGDCKISSQRNKRNFTMPVSGLWQMFRTFVLHCDWSILRILKSGDKET